MENSKQFVPSISFILKKMSDDKALTLFNSISAADGNSYIPLKEMNLTTKQYYSRIKRHKGKYSLTILGKIVHESQTIIGKTLSYYWKLKAIESFEMSASGSSGLPSEETTQLINALINNRQIKDILMKSIVVPSIENDSKALKAATIIDENQRI
jgi:hypothetical protein